MEKNKNNKESKGNIFLIVIFVILGVIVFFLPKVYSYIETLKLPTVEKVEEKQEEQSKEVDEETLESIHYPLMRNSVYSENTYYSLNEFSINDISNSDILLNAFLDIYEGNITASNIKGTCTNTPKEFNVDYLTLRIKNILSKNVKYTLEDFYVPVDSNSNYKGAWSYDSANSKYIYNGVCSTSTNTMMYYDLKELIKAEYDNKDIVVYYYVGFAKVDGNAYIIYSDAGMKNEITRGNFNGQEELDSIFKSIDKKDKKVYKYIFKNNLCSYNEYCLYKGQWTNEL